MIAKVLELNLTKKKKKKKEFASHFAFNGKMWTVWLINDEASHESCFHRPSWISSLMCECVVVTRYIMDCGIEECSEN